MDVVQQDLKQFETLVSLKTELKGDGEIVRLTPLQRDIQPEEKKDEEEKDSSEKITR